MKHLLLTSVLVLFSQSSFASHLSSYGYLPGLGQMLISTVNSAPEFRSGIKVLVNLDRSQCTADSNGFYSTCTEVPRESFEATLVTKQNSEMAGVRATTYSLVKDSGETLADYRLVIHSDSGVKVYKIIKIQDDAVVGVFNLVKGS